MGLEQAATSRGGQSAQASSSRKPDPKTTYEIFDNKTDVALKYIERKSSEASVMKAREHHKTADEATIGYLQFERNLREHGHVAAQDNFAGVMQQRVRKLMQEFAVLQQQAAQSKVNVWSATLQLGQENAAHAKRLYAKAMEARDE